MKNEMTSAASPRGGFAWGGAMLALVFAASPARADEIGAKELPIQWSAPSECPSGRDLSAEVQRLRRDPTAGTQGITRAEVEITGGSVLHYSLLLRLVGSDGSIHERRIDGDTCSAVVDAAAVALALALDEQPSPEAPTSPAPLNPPVSSPSQAAPKIDTFAAPSAAQRAEDVASKPNTEPHAKHPISWDLGAFASSDFAALPNPAPGFGLGLSMTVDKNEIEIRSMGWLPQHATLSSVPTAGGEVGLVVGSVRYARSLLSGLVDILPCGGFEAGAMIGKGVGVATSRLAAGPWAAPSAGVIGMLHATHGFALSLELEGLLLLVRPRFNIVSGGQVYEPPLGTGRAALGLHARFP